MAENVGAVPAGPSQAAAVGASPDASSAAAMPLATAPGVASGAGNGADPTAQEAAQAAADRAAASWREADAPTVGAAEGWPSREELAADEARLAEASVWPEPPPRQDRAAAPADLRTEAGPAELTAANAAMASADPAPQMAALDQEDREASNWALLLGLLFGSFAVSVICIRSIIRNFGDAAFAAKARASFPSFAAEADEGRPGRPPFRFPSLGRRESFGEG